MKFLLKCLLWKRELKVLKDQESAKNTTVQILYKEDLKKTKMVRERISLINDIKEESIPLKMYCRTTTTAKSTSTKTT